MTDNKQAGQSIMIQRPTRRIMFLILSSVAIYIFGKVLVGFLLPALYPHKPANVFDEYVPSLLTMFVLSLYLIRMVGTKELVFSIKNRTVGVIVIGVFVGVIFSWVADYIFINPIREEIVKMKGGAYICAFLTIGVLGPTFEEVICRGYIFEHTRLIFGPSAAWCVNILVFLVLHFLLSSNQIYISQMVFMTIGVSLITFMYQFGGLYASITVHGFMNTYGFLITQ